MKRLSVILFTLALYSSAFSQNLPDPRDLPKHASHDNPAVEIRYEMRPGGSIDYVARKNVPGTFSVMLYFHHYDKILEDRLIYATIEGNKKTILTLKKDDDFTWGKVSMSVHSNMGDIKAEHTPGFIYRLPFSAGKSTTPITMEAKQIDNQPLPQGWRPVDFILEKGDTVFAIRRGKVINIGFSDKNRSTSSMAVEHADGSVAVYNNLENGTMMVALEDIIYPDTPLALAGPYGENTYRVGIRVWSLMKNPKYVPDTGQMPFDFSYIDPVFATPDGPMQYISGEPITAAIDNDIIIKEMTRQEIKRFGK